MKKYSLIKKGNYRQVSSIKRTRFLLLIVVLVLGISFLLPKLVTGLVAVVWYPFDSMRVWVTESGSSLPVYLRDRQVLINEIESLKRARAVEQGTESTIRKLQAENAQLRGVVGAVPTDRLLARVVGRPNQLPYDMLMLDRGREHGVVEQSPVFLGIDQIIGYVTKVNETTSMVSLVTTAGFSATAYIVGPNIYTFTEGMGGGMMRVRVPQGILLQQNDVVILPAIDSGVYGAISDVVTSPTQPEQYGYVPLGVSLQGIQYVSIGRDAVKPHSFEESQALIGSVTSELFKVELPPGVLVTPEQSTTTATTSSTTSTTNSSTTIQ